MILDVQGKIINVRIVINVLRKQKKTNTEKKNIEKLSVNNVVLLHVIMYSRVII